MRAIENQRLPSGISISWVSVRPGWRKASWRFQRGQVPPKREKGKAPEEKRLDTFPALSTRTMVYLGHISFSLYMVHEIVHTAWNWVAAQYEITLSPSWTAKLVFVGLIALSGVPAAALYHLVEEPARHWMRHMLDSGPKHADRPADPPQSRLHPVEARAG